jgi:hypothetical protein
VLEFCAPLAEEGLLFGLREWKVEILIPQDESSRRVQLDAYPLPRKDVNVLESGSLGELFELSGLGWWQVNIRKEDETA